MKMKLCPEGITLTPRGRHLHGTCIPPGCTYPESFVSLRPFFEHFVQCVLFSHGFTRRHVARGTWHVAPRDKSHRRSGALAHLLVFVASKSDRPFRSYSQKSLDRHTHPPTHPPTNRRRPSCKNPPCPEEISIHQNGLTSILLHYDFELEAIS